MEKAKEIRKQLYTEYEMLDMEAEKLEQDFFYGRIQELDYRVLIALKDFEKTEVCYALFESLEPYFTEVKVLADDILELMQKTGSDIEDIEKSKRRQEEFSGLPERHKKVVGYYKDDMIHMRRLISRLKEAVEAEDIDEINETITNFRIVKDLSKISEYDKERALFETFEQVVKNLSEKREQLRVIENSLE